MPSYRLVDLIQGKVFPVINRRSPSLSLKRIPYSLSGTVWSGSSTTVFGGAPWTQEFFESSLLFFPHQALPLQNSFLKIEGNPPFPIGSPWSERAGRDSITFDPRRAIGRFLRGADRLGRGIPHPIKNFPHGDPYGRDLHHGRFSPFSQGALSGPPSQNRVDRSRKSLNRWPLKGSSFPSPTPNVPSQSNPVVLEYQGSSSVIGRQWTILF